MIVRIMTDNQYRLPDDQTAELRRLDDTLDDAMRRSDDPAFRSALQQMIEFVHTHGELVPEDEIVPSDEIIPAQDMTLAEAQSRLETVEAQPKSAP